MRAAILLGGLVAFASNPALAEEPVGDWLVADGSAQIHIEKCGNAWWGFVGWEKDPGGRDGKNPDPGKRDRPTLGLPVVLNMQPSSNPGWWDGEVYNAENGKTYASHMTLEGPDSLRIEGCVLRILCGGQTWTRVKPVDAPAVVAKPTVPAKTRTNSAVAKGAPGNAGRPDYCSGVADLARPPH